MADQPKIELTGESHPVVALALLRLIMDVTKHGAERDRDWVLSTYADCLAVVGGAEVGYDEEEEEGEAAATA